MGIMQQGAYIEIVERTKKPLEPGSVIVPNCVRINGQELLCTADDPIVVERIVASSEDFVRVTLTLIAHRVEIKDEVR